MAVLSDADRKAVWAESMVFSSGLSATIPVLKADLRAAINAVDAWVDANAAAFNAAIPQPARGALSAKAKAELLLFVVRRRWEIT